ncbi:MAG TPA: T9SS type A sorting domain-containing protein, partial [Chitinophagaceae bacterium]|nr:T9SS type A sorting domain-containing protein [Chitinophagaceae bacterium]
TNLCPNTYYEISAWIKNICYKCGCDSNGVASTGAGYIPSALNDSSGVQPNVTFDLNGVDYYTTGNISYGGLAPSTQSGSDSNNTWVKRGFTYLTGAAQTSFTITMRNNAPGGGGNDWALDDIALKTCSPDVTVTPGPNPFVCDSNTVDMGATIASYFNSYVYYTWEKSTDNGATWSATVPAVTGGPTSPTWNGSAWTYDVTYPTFVAYASDSGSQYRVVVASTPTNLSNSSCRFSGGATITLTVDPCGALLDVDILSFKGRNENDQAILYWTTSKEDEPVKYEIQKSKNASSFVTIGEITGYKDPSAETNRYTYVDPELLDNTLSWYRIKAIKTQDNKPKYSKVVQLIGDKAGLQIESLINPFSSHVKFDLISGDDGLVQVEILDQYQHKLKMGSYNLVKGRNSINIDNTDKLPAGFYILRVTSNNNVINRKIIKRG